MKLRKLLVGQVIFDWTLHLIGTIEFLHYRVLLRVLEHILKVGIMNRWGGPSAHGLKFVNPILMNCGHVGHRNWFFEAAEQDAVHSFCLACTRSHQNRPRLFLCQSRVLKILKNVFYTIWSCRV